MVNSQTFNFKFVKEEKNVIEFSNSEEIVCRNFIYLADLNTLRINKETVLLTICIGTHLDLFG